MPGVFLDAPAVLERQLSAYCFDRWMESANPIKTEAAFLSRHRKLLFQELK